MYLDLVKIKLELMLNNKVSKYYFKSCFDRTQIKKKEAFLDQNHGLTPLENAIFETLNYFVFLVHKSLFSI